MLIGHQLNKTYPSGKALEDVSMEIASGQICGLLGRNGAGKTTLFKILCGLIQPDSGSVEIHSTRAKPIGGIIERPGLYPYLSAADNLKVFAGIQGLPTDSGSLQQHLLKVGLPTDRRDPVRNFSLGMKQRLGIAIALLNEPECLVLDEPFSGLDPIGVASLIELIQHLAREEGIAILLSSHLMGELSKCCHYLYVIDQGKLVRFGTTLELIQEHITRFSITAANINKAQALRKYVVSAGINEVKVSCRATEIPGLLKELMEEGLDITSCTPELTLEQLIQKT